MPKQVPSRSLSKSLGDDESAICFGVSCQGSLVNFTLEPFKDGMRQVAQGIVDVSVDAKGKYAGWVRCRLNGRTGVGRSVGQALDALNG